MKNVVIKNKNCNCQVVAADRVGGTEGWCRWRLRRGQGVLDCRSAGGVREATPEIPVSDTAAAAQRRSRTQGGMRTIGKEASASSAMGRACASTSGYVTGAMSAEGRAPASTAEKKHVPGVWWDKNLRAQAAKEQVRGVRRSGLLLRAQTDKEPMQEVQSRQG